MKKVAEYLLIFIAIQFVSLTLANGAVILTGGDVEERAAEAVIAMSIAAFIIVMAVFVVWMKTIAITTNYFKTNCYFQLFLCAVLGFSTIVPSVVMQDMMSGITDSNEEMFKAVIAQPLGFVSLVVLGPVTEEIVFRGAILKQLSKTFSGRWKAVLLSALLFAVIHFNPAQFVHAFLMGTLLGWISIKSKSIVPCILIHIINNGTAFVVIKYYSEVSLNSYMLIITSVVLIIISLLGLNKMYARQ